MGKVKKTYNLDIGWLTPILKFRLVMIIINWVFQGLLYADKTEKMFKLSFEFVLIAFIIIVGHFNNIEIHLFTVVLFAHSFNWIFNGQIFTLLKNFDMVYNEPQRIIDYASDISKRASSEISIRGVVLYGSLSRNELNSASDLDIRIIRKPGVMNALRSCAFCMFERIRALFNKFPLDLYLIDNTVHLLKLRPDEVPIVLYDPENAIILKK